MNIHINKVTGLIVFCIVLSLQLGLYAQELKSGYSVSKPLILDTAQVCFLQEGHHTPQIFIDRGNHIVITCSFEIREIENDKSYRGQKFLLFVCDGKNEWIHSAVTEPGYPWFRGMINNGLCQVYVNRRTYISLYSLTNNMMLPWESKEASEIDKSNIIFDYEQAQRRYPAKLLPVPGDPNSFCTVGLTDEPRYDPLSLASRLLSGGHGGVAFGAFIGKLENGTISEYYDLPVKLKDRECLKYCDSKVDGERIHVVWRKQREYSQDPPTFVYSCFDWGTKKWAEPKDLLHGYEYNKDTSYSCQSASIAYDQKNVYCAWGWEAYNKKSKSSGESGIYFASMMDNQWSEVTKIADTPDFPDVQLIVDNHGLIYAFWPVEAKGMFFRRKRGAIWSNITAAVQDQDERIHYHGSGLGMTPRLRAFDIVLDRSNNFHIAYLHEGSSRKKLPSELVYVKMTVNELTNKQKQPEQ